MEILEDKLAYIEGRKFNVWMQLEVKQKEKILDRMEYIENLVRGKSVIHIGCLDHIDLVEEKLKKNHWFHSRLTNIASECLGLDINKQGINFVRQKFGISNIYYGDIESSEKVSTILSKHWDYAIFGEIIEHLDNPVSFLRKFIQYYGSNVDKIIVTVPNVFKFGNISCIFLNKEIINSDHRYWFTPYTIWKVIHRAGLSAEKIQMCRFVTTGSLREKIKYFILAQFPLLNEIIVLVCQKNTRCIPTINEATV